MISRVVIIVNLILYLAAFITRNIMTRKSTGMQVQAPSVPVAAASGLTALIHIQALVYAVYPAIYSSFLPLNRLNIFPLAIAGYLVLIISQLIGLNALIIMADSWRVGIIESQKTELVTRGVYSISRNPYFLSYLLMFIGYFLILPNLVTIGLIAGCFIFIHWMILKEENYLEKVQGESYLEYKKRTGRYLLWF